MRADLASELGPLKYLSKLTGKSMDDIINWLLLTIIFVFDPLAISLVIAANFAFNTLRKKQSSEEVVVEQVERKAERVKAPTPETDTNPPIVVEEDYLNDFDDVNFDDLDDLDIELKEGSIKNIKGDYKEEITQKSKPKGPKQQPTELKGKFRSKKIDDIKAHKVTKEQYLKAAKKLSDDDLKKTY